jgi:hypothetical protein
MKSPRILQLKLNIKKTLPRREKTTHKRNKVLNSHCKEKSIEE